MAGEKEGDDLSARIQRGQGFQEAEELQRRLYGESTGLYPIPGKDIIEIIDQAEIGPKGDISELSNAIREELAFYNGLVFGPSGETYDLRRRKGESDSNYRERIKPSVIYLQNLFTTVEGATERRNSLYADTAVEEAIERRVRNANRYAEDKAKWKLKAERRYGLINRQRFLEGRPTLSPEQIKSFMDLEEDRLSNEALARIGLVGLENRVASTRLVGQAFIQRMQTCNDPGLAANLLNQDRRYGLPITPDKGHWAAYWGGEEGEIRDKVIVVMMLLAIPPKGEKEKRVIERGSGSAKQVSKLAESAGLDIPTSLYATGFESTKMFIDWYSYLLDRAGGRADLLWEAWQAALVWEIPAQLGSAVEITVEIGKDGKKEIKGEEVNIVAPPIGNAIGPWMMQFQDKQRIEWGLDARGKRILVERNPSHTGNPLNFLGPETYVDHLIAGGSGEIRGAFVGQEDKVKDLLKEPRRVRELMLDMVRQRNPCESFLHESKITLTRKQLLEMGITAENLEKYHPDEGIRKNVKKVRDAAVDAPTTVKINLWDLRIYGSLPFSGRKSADGRTIIEPFPWLSTEEQGEGSEGEFPPGSFGGWILRRFRAWSVVGDIRSRPPLSELSKSEFFADRVRNWQKVFGSIKDVDPSDPDYIQPWQNPRTWWVAGLIQAHTPGHVKELLKETELDYRTSHGGEFAVVKGEGMSREAPTIKDILRNARNAGFLRQEDIDWIVENIGG